MSVAIYTTGVGARLSAAEIALLQDAVSESGRVTLLVPSLEERDACRRGLADAGACLGIDATTPPSWVASLWELFGDGRAIVSNLGRQLLMASVLATADAGARGPLRDTPGTVRMLSRMARDLLPAIMTGTAEPTSDAEGAVFSLVRIYHDALRERGLVELSEAVESLASSFAGDLPACARAVVVRDVTMLPGYLIRLFATIGKAGSLSFLLGAEQEAFAGDLDAALRAAGCDVSRAVLDGADTAPNPVGPSFLEVAGPHAKAAAYVAEIERLATRARERGEGGGSIPCIGVVSSRPAELFDELASRLATRSIAAGTTRFSRFNETIAGQQFTALTDLVRRMRACEEEGASAAEWWPAPELTDWLYVPLSGADATRARAFDKRLRGTRCLTPDDVQRELQSVQGKVRSARAKLSDDHPFKKVPCVAADVVQFLWQERPVSALKAMLSVAEAAPASVFGAHDGQARVLAEQAVLRRAIETIGDCAHALGISQPVACSVLDGLCVASRAQSAPEGEPAAHVRFLSIDHAALLPTGTVDALLFTDVDVHGYPLAHEEGPLATMSIALDRSTVAIEPVARIRTLFARALSAAPVAVLARVTHDRQAKDRYPAAIWTEFISRAGAKPVSVGEGAIVRDLDTAAGEGLRAEFVACLPPQQLGDDALPYLVPRRLDENGELTPNQFSASQIESYASCPLCWFMGSRVRPQQLDAGFGNMEKGNFVHDVMERFHVYLHDKGLRRVTPDALELLRPILRTIFAEVRAEHERGKTSSSAPLVPLSTVESLQVDDILPQLDAAIRYEARALAPFAPEYFEYSFNGLGVTYAGWPLGGRIDRVDVDAEGRAVIIDYKHRADVKQFRLKDPTVADKTGDAPADDPRWLPEHTQSLIYAQALRRAMNLDVRGALYFSTKTRNPAMNGAISAELAEVECGDGRVPGLKTGFPDEEHGGTCTFDALLDRVEAGIAQRLDELSAGAVAAASEHTSRCDFNHPLGFERRGM